MSVLPFRIRPRRNGTTWFDLLLRSFNFTSSIRLRTERRSIHLVLGRISWVTLLPSTAQTDSAPRGRPFSISAASIRSPSTRTRQSSRFLLNPAIPFDPRWSPPSPFAMKMKEGPRLLKPPPLPPLLHPPGHFRIPPH